MNLLKTGHARHYFRCHAKQKPGINLYPLLGILLVILAAVLGYGAMYFLLTA